MRLLGSKLMFLDIERDGQRLQAMVELKNLSPRTDTSGDDFKSFKKVVRIGDWVCKWQGLSSWFVLMANSSQR